MRVWVVGELCQAEARVVAWAGPVPGLKAGFQQGVDIHCWVAQQIARVVQEHQIPMPGGLFTRKPWTEFGPGDSERQTAKTTVHACNYAMGADKFGRITGLPPRYAKDLQAVYLSCFPEVRTGYQARIIAALKRSKTVVLPSPFRWKKRFYDLYSTEVERAAFAFYAQSTIGALLSAIWVRLTASCDSAPLGRWTPDAIRGRGLEARLQHHDEIAIACEETDVERVIATVEDAAQIPIRLGSEEDDRLVVPIAFRVGRTWGDVKGIDRAAATTLGLVARV